MATSLSGLYVLFIAVLIVFQIALILGAPWGGLTQGGRSEGALPRSGRINAAVSIIVLLLMAGAALSAVGRFPGWPAWTGWLAVIVSAVSMVLNWITPSDAERQLWGPVTTLMFLLVLGVMLTRGG